MTRLFSTLFLACTLFLLNAQTIIWEEQFDGGIPETWTIGPGNPEGAVWQWSASGKADSALLAEPTQALLWNDKGPIESPSVANGAAMYNSDVYDTGGTAFGAGPFPGQHSGSLTSPLIDLSDHSEVFLKFNQYAHANGAAVSTLLEISSDGGETWTDIPINPGVVLNSSTEPDDVQLIDVSDLAGGQENVQIRFTWNGRFYFWLLDDIQFIETPANNLALGSVVHYPPSNYAQPVSMIFTDTMSFFATISNLGSQDQNNVVLKAWIDNIEGETLFIDSTVVSEVAAGTTDLMVTLDSIYMPEWLNIENIYTVHYLVYSLDDPDGDIAAEDNSYSANFVVTESTFAQDDGNGLEGMGVDANWVIGNVYQLPVLEFIVGTQLEATSAIFSASRNSMDGPLEGEQVMVMLFKVKNEVLPDWSNFDLTSIGQDDDLQLLSLDTFMFPEGHQNFELVELELNALGGEGHPVLDIDTRYILAVSYEGSANNILHSVDTDISYDNRVSSMLYVDQWSLDGFGPDAAPLLRLNIDLVVNTDESSLPDRALQIFPNPATDKLTLNISTQSEKEGLLIIADTSGRVINYQMIEIADGQKEVELNVSQYAQGQYLVKLATKEGSLTKSFVVVK